MPDRHEQPHPQERLEVNTQKPEVALEQLVQQLLAASEQVVAERLVAPAEVRSEAIERLGGNPAEVRAITEHTLAAAQRLQAELKAALQAEVADPELIAQLTAQAEQVLGKTDLTAAPTATDVNIPKPSIDGIKPPEADPAAAAGEDDWGEEAQAKRTQTAITAAVETMDPYAERNRASATLLARLKEPDLSFPGQSDLELLKHVRELIIRHEHEPLAVRLDDLGNVVIGRPESSGNGLSSRLITLHADTDQGTITWLERTVPAEFNLLKRYNVHPVDDRLLDHEPEAEVNQAAA